MKLKSGLLILLMAGAAPLAGQAGRQFINLSDSKDFKGMQILDSALQDKRIMVLGINRYYSEITRTVCIKFISYARKKKGYRNILAPVSPICGEWLNRFVYLNDFSVLNDLNLAMEPKDVLFYKRLNTLNEGIPDSLKFRIIGIGPENKTLIPALGIYKLLNGKNPPDRLRIPIEALMGAVRYQQLKNDTLNNYNAEGKFRINNTLVTFNRSFDTLKNAYQNWLGDTDWFRMEAYMVSLKSAIQYETLENTAMEDPVRVSMVVENIKSTILSHPNERFVAIIGRCYASKIWLQGSCQLYNFSPVCSKIMEDTIMGAQVFNVGVYYNEAADAEDEPLEIKTMLQAIRSGAPVSSTSLTGSIKTNQSAPFNYMLVMGGSNKINVVLPDNLTPQISKRMKSRAMLSTGVNMGYHIVDVVALSKLMSGYGLPKVEIIPDFGLNISTHDKENFLYEAGFFQRMRIPGSAYHYWGTYFSAVNEFYTPAHWLKLGLGINIGYQQHYVNNPYTLNDTIFISRYTMPTRAVNPVYTFGITAKSKINLSRFFLRTELGYGRDISDNRWRVNNQYSGPMGQFKGNQVFLNITAGFHLVTENSPKRKEKL
ncbi:MAG: hypothetical protein FJ347_06840 [Sphingomonadales bacterium]|nr:hypothetical protein [Sphingomonadales bacterium]